MQWSQQQAGALQAVSKWANDKSGQQIFRLFGFAGSGKTTLAKELAGSIKGTVLFGAFTGKAALVLKSKGCTGASTIHSMIYKVIENEDGKPSFMLNPDSPARVASLIIIDECSMVDEELGNDLLSFGKKILVLGDPAQLPPVKGVGFFTDHEPDVMLTDIHRQAADNPIIRMSIDIREGRRLAVGQYGDSKVITKGMLEQEEVMGSDQVIVGLNNTRRNYNFRIRQLRGFLDDIPTSGDKLICLRNNRDKGLLNGGLWTAGQTRIDTVSDIKIVRFEAESQDDPSHTVPVEMGVPMDFFVGDEKAIPYYVRKEFDEFTFGYAITCHKSQGSQWDNVMVFNESASFRQEAKRWLYTALTRSAERVTVVL